MKIKITNLPLMILQVEKQEARRRHCHFVALTVTPAFLPTCQGGPVQPPSSSGLCHTGLAWQAHTACARLSVGVKTRSTEEGKIWRSIFFIFLRCFGIGLHCFVELLRCRLNPHLATFTLVTLLDEAPQKRPAVITEGGCLVSVDLDRRQK